jgi:branched-chain amino acid transport system ATP-binding protein
MSDAPALAVEAINAGYGRTTVLWDIDVVVGAGEVVALLGPNGAGKTTLLRTIAGYITPTAGAIRIGGVAAPVRPYQRAQAGLTLIPEGRGVFPNLTVRENLRLQLPPWLRHRSLEPALDAFPILRKRLGQKAGTLSGGEQQMLALSRCFVAAPRIVLLDEVSMGLAPRIVDQIFEALRALASTGVSLLLVEQYIAKALSMADVVHVLDRGRVTFSGSPADIDEDALTRHYLASQRPAN